MLQVPQNMLRGSTSHWPWLRIEASAATSTPKAAARMDAIAPRLTEGNSTCLDYFDPWVLFSMEGREQEFWFRRRAYGSE